MFAATFSCSFVVDRGAFNGGNGTDTITFSGTANGIITSTPTSIGNLNGANTVLEIEGATFNAPFQENTFDLTSAPFPSTVNGNNSNDVFYSSAFNDTFNGGGQGIADIFGAKTDSANVQISSVGGGGATMTGTTVGTDTMTNVERAQVLSPSVLGPSSVTAGSTWDASTFIGPVDLEGGTGNDTLIGGAAGDTLGAPAVNMAGSLEEGDDTLIGNGGGDALRGGPGTDTARQTGVASATVGASSMNANGTDTFNSIDVVSLSGTGGPDTMTATAFGGRVIFEGFGASDTLTGSGHDDEISGGDGADSLTGGGGIDTLKETAFAPTSAVLTNTTLSGFGGTPTETISLFERATRKPSRRPPVAMRVTGAPACHSSPHERRPDITGVRRLRSARGPLPADAVRPDDRPLGMDRLGARGAPPRPLHRGAGTAVVEAAPRADHDTARAHRRGGAHAVAVRGAARRAGVAGGGGAPGQQARRAVGRGDRRGGPRAEHRLAARVRARLHGAAGDRASARGRGPAPLGPAEARARSSPAWPRSAVPRRSFSVAVYGAVQWRRGRLAVGLVAAVVAAVVGLWVVPDWIGSGDPLHAAHVAGLVEASGARRRSTRSAPGRSSSPGR